MGAAVAIASDRASASEAETRAAVVTITDPSTPDDAARAMRDEIATAFARAAAYGGVKVLDAAATSAGLGGADARTRAAKLEAAAAQAKRGRALYAQLEFEQAARELEAARDAMIASLSAQNDGALVDVLLDLGGADLDLRRADAAREAFRQARVAGAPESLSAPYSARTAAAYRDAIVSLKSRTGASLEVITSPAGAKVAIDGRAAGVSPLFASGLVDGPHVIRAELPGSQPAFDSATLTVGRVARLSLTLPAAIPDGVRAGSPEDELRAVLAAGDALNVDLVLATGIARSSDGPRVRTLLVDVKRRLVVAMASGAGDPTEKSTLEKAGLAAGERARDHLKNAPPLPAPAALRFDEVRSAR